LLISVDLLGQNWDSVHRVFECDIKLEPCHILPTEIIIISSDEETTRGSKKTRKSRKTRSRSNRRGKRI